MLVHVCIRSAKKLAKHLYLHPSILCQKVSKQNPIFSKSLKTVTMISAEASTVERGVNYELDRLWLRG
jgi:hypothetical protein